MTVLTFVFLADVTLLLSERGDIISDLVGNLSVDQLHEVMDHAMASDLCMTSNVWEDHDQEQVMFSIEWGSCRTKSRFEFAVRSRNELC